ncbi:hypothetical protein AXF42_Ash004351 [Apostasia shenzhenica]|uniref:Heptahelical transmembrane protein 4 n=1 Tax=Apostasia shenzhenica TaxID=1088818 RepID=A0A2I0A2P5_9ASPA|nr:hypothetical protein AXF42_Ash004351 [Apostasia shenzhenica]
MCFDASAMASSPVSSKLSFSFSESATQFLISPREIKKCHNKKITASPSDPKLELVDYDSLPEFLKHNEFVQNYYRSEWPLKHTILSIFSIHNETLNIWTHLIGFFIFLLLTAYAASLFPVSAYNNFANAQLAASNSSNIYSYIAPITTSPEMVEVQPVPRWPFYLYLAGAMFCLLMSSGCHLLSCHSARTSYLMLRLDFAGISALIVSSFYPLVYYSFACNPFFRDLYLGSITVFGAATAVVSLMPVFDSPQFRPVRAVLFACMGASGLLPITHKMLAFGDRPEAAVTAGYEALMGVFYGMGVVVYAARVPERWLPGKFDLIGHSHQLFHVLVVAGAYTQYLAGLVYLAWREAEGC